jgi:cytochrome c oxidase subunit 3
MNHNNDNAYSLGIKPGVIILALLLFGITMMFLSCTVAYTYTRVEHGLTPLKLPMIFLVNTFILIGSSFSLRWAQKSYVKDNTDDYKSALLTTSILSLLFLAAQIYGWKQLFDNNIYIHSNNGASYLYLISGLHFLHVIGGLPFLAFFLYDARKKMVEPVSVLIYFSDPTKRMQLKLITWYWHFLDILWIYLVLFFGINALI